MELFGHKVVADTIQAAVGRGNTPRQGGEVLHNLDQETGSSDTFHYEPGKYSKVGWQKTY